MSNDAGEAFGALIGAMLMAAVVITAIVVAVASLLSVGTVFGAGVSLRNYYLAFRQNVQPERAVP